MTIAQRTSHRLLDNLSGRCSQLPPGQVVAPGSLPLFQITSLTKSESRIPIRTTSPWPYQQPQQLLSCSMGGHGTEPHEQKTQQSPGWGLQQSAKALAITEKLPRRRRHFLDTRVPAVGTMVVRPSTASGMWVTWSGMTTALHAKCLGERCLRLPGR